MIRARSLKTSLLLSFLVIIGVLGISVSVLGTYLINRYIIDKAQGQVKMDLNSARNVYLEITDELERVFSLISYYDYVDAREMKTKLGLDYLYILPRKDLLSAKSEIVRKAMASSEGVGGTREIDKKELIGMGADIYRKAVIKINYTLKARPTKLELLDKAMAVEYAKPIRKNKESKDMDYVICGGKIINRDFDLVDKIRGMVFEDKIYGGKPVGTVTIFQDDVRIATNVLDKDGKRAVGTRVSENVYRKVFEKGETWLDKAFVVTDWYLTAYEPIKDINAKTIGILYVGILEKPFKDFARNIFMAFLAVILFAVILAVIFSVFLADMITGLVTHLLDGINKISSGEDGHDVGADNPIRELNQLAESFNEMAAKLGDSHRRTRLSNEDLSILNKRYLDLISFVSHELKGILASTILNAYSVRDGFLGMINFKQRKALDSITRNLDYLASTVQNFLNLSRIEKGEMSVHKRPVNLKEEILDVSIDAFTKQIEEKNIKLINNLKHEIVVDADKDLLLIVLNNLVSNAVKYGTEGGYIMINAGPDSHGNIEVEVYNDGRPLTHEETDRLFKRFSRLSAPEAKHVKGTGLGLFITKEIVESHGGEIIVKSMEKGNSFIFTVKGGVDHGDTVGNN
ncbi:MAG: cache domain-containing protein [Candidatus Omnitrophica bacterium]|nr:cache domain-containing protein [Candidatus Omnitrophota bacterium]